QLTMRTFHIGGTASRIIEQSFLKSKFKGIVKYHGLKTVKQKEGDIIVLNRNGQISINDENGRELEKHMVPSGSILYLGDGKEIEKNIIFVRWDPYTSPILTELSGKVRYEDVIEEVTMAEETDEATGLSERVIIEQKGEYHPQIIIEDVKKEVLAIYPIPAGAHIVPQDGAFVNAGDLIAKTPRQVSKTKDITGGLPRVAELFEARRPKDPAMISEIDGIVEFATSKKGQRRIIVKSASGMKREYIIPHGKHLNVYKGDRVKTGDQLVDGPINPQDILKVSGEKRLQEYLVNEVQEVYRLQGVRINDKHIEIIVKQMLKKIKVEDPGDTKKKGKSASATPILLGITKASLSTESFISAASFQETTRVLAEAAASGKIDDLRGLKENVIMGHLVPAGTGFSSHANIEMFKEAQESKEEALKPKSAGQANEKKEKGEKE
ncbi:MAG: DNA-directed RNA polymerase subunit beta', partial [Candidatus Omnitrophica bacterium]|nr:DNA-directed RNA polymerase subunit beta' [Candidatus Omnitrophota bacterium]